MERIIVYLDDAAHARGQLAPLRSGATHWLLVACAPRMTQRIGKWVSHGSRERWRTQWAERLFAAIEPDLRARGDRVTALLATGPLPPLAARLQADHGPCRVVDARRPKSDPPPGRWQGAGTLMGLAAALLLTAE